MKKIILTLFALAAFSSLNAQSFDKGTTVVTAGVGLGGDFGTPFGAGLEIGISDKIGIGGFVGYGSVDTFGVKVTDILVAAKGNYHFYQTDKFDTYAGALLGYDIAKATVAGGGISTGSYGGVVFGGQVGARYYFSDSIGAFAELGYGLANLNIGIAFKI